MTATALEAVGLARRFAGRAVVADAGLALRPGEIVTLVGPSGCGKTTFLQMLGLLDRPDAGRVVIDGEDAWAQGDAARSRLRLATLGFVFQTRNLVDHLSLRDNVALPHWRLHGRRSEARAAADELLGRFGLAARAGALARDLSPGEAQRGAVARALVNRPAVVLADEPTGSLDSTSGADVLAALEEARGAGAALLVVTHDPAVARVGRAMGMRDGRLVTAPERR